MRALLLSVVLLLPLTACERLGITDPAKQAAARDEEGKAIGGACRQSGRALEDCFTLNPDAVKASVFNGWKDMNDYMTQNKIETVKPEFPVAGMLSPKHRAGGDSDSGTDQSAAADDEDDHRAEVIREARKRRAMSSAK